MGEPNEIQTPVGLDRSGYVSLNLPMYIMNYKGGRNECFMYGRDLNTKWFDYDLASAYTTGMSILSHPDYSNAIRLTGSTLSNYTSLELIFSYTVLQVDFKFKEEVKYPSIPVKVDEVTTVYPLEGEGYVSGPEYVVALSPTPPKEHSTGVYSHIQSVLLT